MICIAHYSIYIPSLIYALILTVDDASFFFFNFLCSPNGIVFALIHTCSMHFDSFFSSLFLILSQHELLWLTIRHSFGPFWKLLMSDKRIQIEAFILMKDIYDMECCSIECLITVFILCSFVDLCYN